MPDGSLCTASVEQIFPRDSVRRNCFELALYIMTASPTASVRVYETVRDADVVALRWLRSQHCRCEIASCRTLIGSGDMLMALHRQATRSHRPSTAMPLAAAPYRASGLVLWHFSDLARCVRLVCYLGNSGHAPPSPIRSFSAPIDAAVSCHDGRGSCLKTRCTTLVPMPSFRPILTMPSPLAFSSRIRASTAGSTRRRPSLVPFALARRRGDQTIAPV